MENSRPRIGTEQLKTEGADRKKEASLALLRFQVRISTEMRNYCFVRICARSLPERAQLLKGLDIWVVCSVVP